MTDFGIVELPKSWLLYHYMKLSDLHREEIESKPAHVRYLYGNVRNHAQETLDAYFRYVNEMVELGYGYGKANWQVSFLSFHDWLRQKENGDTTDKGGSGHGAPRTPKGFA